MNTEKTRFIRGTNPDAIMEKVKIEKDELAMKVDEYAKLSLQYAEAEKAFKDKTKATKARMESLKLELLGTAEKLKTTILHGEELDLEVAGRNSRDIKPQNLFVFFKKMGDTLKFFEFVKVALGDLEKNLGKAIVDSSGLVDNTYNPYSSLKVKPKLTN